MTHVYDQVNVGCLSKLKSCINRYVI